MKKCIGVLLLLATLSTTANAQVACLPGSLSSGIMAFYPFSSGSINDFSGGAHHLVNPTTAAASTDRFGNLNCAFHFVKTAGDYLHVPGGAFVNGITASPFSISLWFQGTGTRGMGDFEMLMGRGTPGGSAHCPDTWQQWSVALFDCRRPVAGFNRRRTWDTASILLSSGCTATMTHFSGSWHHLVLVYTGTARNMYVDGILSFNVSDTCGASTLDLGDLVLGDKYTGDLDDILIYNRALTATEVSALHSAVACCGTTIPTAIANNNPVTPPAGVKIFPNPSDNRISVSSGSTIRSISICTASGAEYAAYSFDSKDVSLDIDALAPGMYLVKVTTDAETTIEKLIKK